LKQYSPCGLHPVPQAADDADAAAEEYDSTPARIDINPRIQDCGKIRITRVFVTLSNIAVDFV
jgi:hypothetical protein